jgi:hypothetical protein
MFWFFSVAYVCLHFFVYVLVLRHRPILRTEKGVFFYHSLSFVSILLIGLVLFAVAPGANTFSQAVGIAALHGIYSLTFLEVWALSEGGYSLRVLKAVFSAPGIGKAEIVERFTGLSERKKAGRLSALEGLRLVVCRDGTYRPTRTGWFVASFLAALSWLAGYRTTG